MHSAPDIAADKKAEAQVTPPVDVATLPKTRGETFYDGLQFTMGKAAIMAATAALAYIGRYGKDKYGPVPNYFKQFQEWIHHKLLTNKTFPLGEKGELGKRLAAVFSNTMLIFHGGNIFAPIMKVMENNHENIANFVNRRWGNPEDVDIAHERLKDKPKQTWGDVIKGRVGAWILVFSSFLAVDTVSGKDKKTGLHYFDKYEEWFGRWVAGFTKGGRELSKIPVTKALTAAQDANKTYRFGKILALDFYATSAAIILWTAISRSSAQKRQEKNGHAEPDESAIPPVMLPLVAQSATVPRQYAQAIAPREKPVPSSFMDRAAGQQASEMELS